jgi:FkbM family methyltransferase
MIEISKTYISSLIPKNSMILDVGAYNGRDAAELSEACSSDIHVFEPYPASYESIKLLHNPRLILWPYALGGFKGKIPMHIAKGHVQSNSIREPKKHKKIWPDIKFRGKVDIQIIMLDDWFRAWQNENPDCKGIDLAWVDVNGSEADFIFGGMKTLAVTKYIYIEYCAIQLYDGAMNKEQTMKMLSGFELMGEYNAGPSYGNIFLKNKNKELWLA